MAKKDEPKTSNNSKSKQKLDTQASSTPSDSTTAQQHVTVDDMHELLGFIREALVSRDKVVDLLQYEIELNQQQIEQNKEILARRGTIYKLIFALLAIGVLAVGYDQYSIIKTFETDMNDIADDMGVMKNEMTEMRKAILTMTKDIHSMSTDFSHVARDVNSISRGVYGMSYDTRQMNRTMNTMSPPWK